MDINQIVTLMNDNFKLSAKREKEEASVREYNKVSDKPSWGSDTGAKEVNL